VEYLIDGSLDEFLCHHCGSRVTDTPAGIIEMIYDAPDKQLGEVLIECRWCGAKNLIRWQRHISYQVEQPIETYLRYCLFHTVAYGPVMIFVQQVMRGSKTYYKAWTGDQMVEIPAMKLAGADKELPDNGESWEIVRQLEESYCTRYAVQMKKHHQVLDRLQGGLTPSLFWDAVKKYGRYKEHEKIKCAAHRRS